MDEMNSKNGAFLYTPCFYRFLGHFYSAIKIAFDLNADRSLQLKIKINYYRSLFMFDNESNRLDRLQ